MKKKVTSIATAVVAVLLAFGPQFLFQPCPTTEKVMKCFYSCKALIAIGLILLAVGALQFLANEAKTKKSLAVVGIVACVCAILIPTVLIGGCAKPEMACKLLTFPITHSLSVIGIVLQVITLLSKEK